MFFNETKSSITRYFPHKGKYIVDIGNGTNKAKIDWAVILTENSTSGVVLLKKEKSVVAFDLNLFINKDYSNPLNSKTLDTTDLAYDKLMKWIGKMAKKDYRGRYYNNKQDRGYTYDNELFTDSELNKLSNSIKKEIYHIYKVSY